ncbi:extracellular solute-binding protein [Patescibacteria group bacterium]|nr:extracellular solute-binding protein [Patescibacteria group bacterium]
MKQLGIKNIITGIFFLSALVALLIFSGIVNIGQDPQTASGRVVVWGDVSAQIVDPLIGFAGDQNLDVVYIQRPTATYEDDLINAFASGTGPDLFIMNHEGLIRHRDKIFEIPYASFPQDSFESLYIDEARLFLTPTGITGLPITVDPLVMYYNKQLFASSFILDIPEYWDDFTTFAPKVTTSSSSGEILLSAVALGSYDNIEHAKAILSALLLQNGNNVVARDEFSGDYYSTLAFQDGFDIAAAQAFDFYTSFAQFGTNTYSWNEALIDAQSKFIAGEVAVYFGRASEAEEIRRKNPNLDFGVSLFPQLRSNNVRITQGSMLGVGIAKQTQNITGSFAVASNLAGGDFSSFLADALLVAPASKPLLRETPDDAFTTLVYNSAIISRGWIDPAPTRTANLFRTIVKNINNDALTTEAAIARASRDLDTILDQTINKFRVPTQ